MPVTKPKTRAPVGLSIKISMKRTSGGHHDSHALNDVVDLNFDGMSCEVCGLHHI